MKSCRSKLGPHRRVGKCRASNDVEIKFQQKSPAKQFASLENLVTRKLGALGKPEPTVHVRRIPLRLLSRATTQPFLLHTELSLMTEKQLNGFYRSAHVQNVLVVCFEPFVPGFSTDSLSLTLSLSGALSVLQIVTLLSVHNISAVHTPGLILEGKLNFHLATQSLRTINALSRQHCMLFAVQERCTAFSYNTQKTCHLYKPTKVDLRLYLQPQPGTDTFSAHFKVNIGPCHWSNFIQLTRTSPKQSLSFDIVLTTQTNWQRTVIFLYRETHSGEDMFITGSTNQNTKPGTQISSTMVNDVFKYLLKERRFVNFRLSSSRKRKT